MKHEFEYQSIDSAPKDRAIVLYCPGRKKWRYGIWDDQKHHKRPRPYWNTYDTFAEFDRQDQPIYWTTALALIPLEVADE